MSDPGPMFITREIRAGFLAPFDSLRFLKRHKLLLVMGLAPQILGIVAFFWAFDRYGVPALLDLLAEFDVGQNLAGFLRNAIISGFYLAAIVLYPILGVPVIDVIASPLYDVIAQNAYEKTANLRVASPSFADFLRSLLSEASKLVIILALVVVFTFAPLLAPFGFLFSIWFFGWDHMDRTLSIMGFSLPRRVVFGVKHMIACMCLGIWRYVPFVGTLFTFAMSGAGAIAVAGVQSKKDRELVRTHPGSLPGSSAP